MAKTQHAGVAVLAHVRQLTYPPEFRIAPAVWPLGLLPVLEELTKVATPPQSAEEPAVGKEWMRFLADVGTGLWRLRQKMVQPGTDWPLEEMGRAYRHLKAVWDALTQAGVEIQDHTDTPFDPGMALKVIAFQPTPGVEREQIIETIIPTIYYKGQTIQMGEVIVATWDTPGDRTAQPPLHEQRIQGDSSHGESNR